MASKKDTYRKEVLSAIGILFPTIKTELNYSTHFQFLLSVIFSAQATDVGVNKMTATLFLRVKEPQDVLAMSLEEFQEMCKSINYYRNKAKFVRQTAAILLEQYGGEVPDSLEELQKLPWVGIKTAKVVSSVLFDRAYVGVDTHIHRVANRLGWVHTKSPEETDRALEKLLSEEEKRAYRHSLVLFGRYICTARAPKCATCTCRAYCPSAQEW